MTLNKTLIIQQIKSYNPSHLVIGYSGGVDSSVLLNICKDLDISIIAIYINHNIHSQSLEWQNHCHEVCKNLQIRFITHLLEKCPKGENFEAWASKQRMSFFQKIMKDLPSPLLLLGHHQDDQAETFLIQAIRGAGLAGLAGIPYYKKLQFGAVLRPLLDYTKQDIEQFSIQNNISHIYDDSNEDTKYRRNLIRNKVIPILQRINPNISKTLSRSASICAQSNRVLDKLLADKLKIVSKENRIIISKLTESDSDIQQSLIHFWFKKVTSYSLKNNQVNSIYTAINSQSTTGWKLDTNLDYTIHIEYDELVIRSYIKVNKENSTRDITKWLQLNINQKIDFKNIIIRYRKADDRCKYIGRNKQNKLKILFQELEIPSDQRSKAKVIELDGKIIAVYPFFICD